MTVFTRGVCNAARNDDATNDATYEDAKAALLLAYKVVPKVHRKKFRTQYKSEKKTYAGHAYNLNTLFKKWATSLHAYNNLQRLREIILLQDSTNLCLIIYECGRWIKIHRQ